MEAVHELDLYVEAQIYSSHQSASLVIGNKFIGAKSRRPRPKVRALWLCSLTLICKFMNANIRGTVAAQVGC